MNFFVLRQWQFNIVYNLIFLTIISICSKLTLLEVLLKSTYWLYSLFKKYLFAEYFSKKLALKWKRHGNFTLKPST